MKSRVFITHAQTKFDYGPAAEFGVPEVVSTRVYSFAPGNLVNEGILNNISAAAATFSPVDDFVLPSGSAIMTSMFITALVARGVYKIRVLLWSAADGMYSVGHLDLTPLLSKASHG